MRSRDGKWVITYNGELYGEKASREALQKSGMRFRGTSDTEVLLELIAQKGVVAAAYELSGMWAFAAHNLDTGELWLCRDRFGEKPLYWTLGPPGFGRVAFASELKAIRALVDWPVAIDQESFADYVRYGAVQSPRSIYENVFQLQPGCAVLLQLDTDGRCVKAPQHFQYWNAADEAHNAQKEPLKLSRAETATALEKLLAKTVGDRMVADVPVGAFLSGGIDSSAIVAMMCQNLSPASVKTFTIGFAEEHMSEASEAAAVARHLGTDHTELLVDAKRALEVIPKLAEMYCEPFADSSEIPTHLVSAMARTSVTVALSGDAGDELFGGYNRYFLADKHADKLGRIPLVARIAFGRSILAIPPARWDRLGSIISKGPVPLLQNMKGGIGSRAHKLAGLVSAENKSSLYSSMLAVWPDSAGLLSNRTSGETLNLDSRFSYVEQMMVHDTQHYLPSDILTKVDRAAMASGLETRVPFLDPAIFRFAWSLPLSSKVGGGVGKIVLRDALAAHVPRDLWDRPKTGFGVPLNDWLRGPLRPWAEELLSPKAMNRHELFNTDIVRRCWEQHLSGDANWQHRLWVVLMFQAWHRNWMV